MGNVINNQDVSEVAKIFVVGGSNTEGPLGDGEIFNVSEKKWENLKCVKKGVPIDGAAGIELDGKLYLCGGIIAENDHEQSQEMQPFSNQVQHLDLHRYQWENSREMNSQRGGAVAAALDGKLFVIGGQQDLITVLTTVESYNPQFNEWNQVADLQEARTSACATSCSTKQSKKIFVMGGKKWISANDEDCPDDGKWEYLNTCECLDETHDETKSKWKLMEPMKTRRSKAVAVMCQGIIYVIGGSSNGTNRLNTVECYDPNVGKWEPFTSLNLPRSSAAAVVINKKKYMCLADPMNL